MFERFTDRARLVVVAAQGQARDRGAAAIRTEHLLLAVYAVPENLALTILDGIGLTLEQVVAAVDRCTPGGAADRAALATLGIDLDEVRRQVEEAFGPGALDRTRAALGEGGGPRRGGHLPFDRSAKKALELALREALRLKHNYIGAEHVLLGLAHAEGGARAVLAQRGLTVEVLRIIVEEMVRGRAAG